MAQKKICFLLISGLECDCGAFVVEMGPLDGFDELPDFPPFLLDNATGRYFELKIEEGGVRNTEHPLGLLRYYWFGWIERTEVRGERDPVKRLEKLAEAALSEASRADEPEEILALLRCSVANLSNGSLLADVLEREEDKVRLERRLAEVREIFESRFPGYQT